MSLKETDWLDPRIEGQYVMRTDPHCHILPGLDDGSPTLEMSLAMARRMAGLGIRNVVATPHGVHPAIETNTHPDYLREQVAALNEAIRDEGIDLTVHPGTEVFVQSRTIGAYERGEVMTWADQGRFILVEFGFQRHYPAAMDVVDYFIQQGLTPMIAHPERYTWLPTEPEFFRELNDRGCVFQFNVMSINGHFGPRTQELAMRLLPAAGAFIIGTDSHHDADRYFDLSRVRETLRSLGMADDNGQFPIGLGRPFPDISDLALPNR